MSTSPEPTLRDIKQQLDRIEAAIKKEEKEIQSQQQGSFASSELPEK
jgi:hypothetical protein